MSTNEIDAFLAQLDKIDQEENKKKGKDVKLKMKHTRELLMVGDDIFNSSIELQKKLKEARFRQTISGNSYIKETFQGETYRRPVIDLVQQGGTMLGIALLGYTYIMEKAGIRFRSMAGTSAGAINTLLLSALPEKIYETTSPFITDGRQALKSEFLAYLVANKDFCTLLDRKGTIGHIQGWLVNRITWIGKLMPLFLVVLLVGSLGTSFWIYKSLNNCLFTTANGLTESEVSVYAFITGILCMAAPFLLILLLLFRLFKTNLGVNPGVKVYDWITKILRTDFVNIKTTFDLKERRKGIKVSEDGSEKPFSDPRLVFIAANLTNNRIVKFPDNNIDYWNTEYIELVSPATYVRASMSLPFIFYAFVPLDEHVCIPEGVKLKSKGTLHSLARFIDGGMLSNFPIREFHVAPPTHPRYPTFGVLLSGSYPKSSSASNAESTEEEKARLKKEKARINKEFWLLSVFKFILSFISTFRSFYDKDFLVTHPEFEHLVEAVNTREFNSLDFAMKLDTKKKLFEQGARSAVKQLQKFDWEIYLKERTKEPVKPLI